MSNSLTKHCPLCWDGGKDLTDLQLQVHFRDHMSNSTQNEVKKDVCLCLDDWFPGCDGTRTHPLRLSQILAIPEVSKALADARKEVIDSLWELKYDLESGDCFCASKLSDVLATLREEEKRDYSFITGVEFNKDDIIHDELDC